MLTMCPRNASAQSQLLCPKKVQGDIFTFDTESLRAVSRCQPSRSSRRPRRILYPAFSRRYLPPRQRDHIKSCLLLLCALVTLQIYWEEPGAEAELSNPGQPGDSPAGGLPPNSSQADTGLEKPPGVRGCAYLELYTEATALRL
ncbi:torsin-4A-like [Mustelus asterias]